MKTLYVLHIVQNVQIVKIFMPCSVAVETNIDDDNIVNISFVDLDKSIIGLNIQVAIVVLSKSY